jgi:serine/threonine protein kinase
MELLNVTSTSLTPEALLQEAGTVFARFDSRTQDSGNVSYGVAVDDHRYFVKTAGSPDTPAFLDHYARVRWLRNARRMRLSLDYAALPPLLNCIESSHGPMLVYEWRTGELLGVPAAQRGDVNKPFMCFKALPLSDLIAALDVVLDFHRFVCSRGWIANDFYDGSMLYDFDARRLTLIDLDLYRPGPFHNDMGRMFGSSRFMAPEEFESGAIIDQRTTVFTMGRCLLVFLDDRFLHDRNLAVLQAIAHRACARNPEDRFAAMDALYGAWRESLDALGVGA